MRTFEVEINAVVGNRGTLIAGCFFGTGFFSSYSNFISCFLGFKQLGAKFYFSPPNWISQFRNPIGGTIFEI